MQFEVGWMSNFLITPAGMAEILSGVALLALGLAILRTGFGKRINQVFFLYLFLWGGFAVLYGFSKSTGDLRAATFFTYVSIHFEIFSLGTMLAVAALFPRRTRLARSPVFWATLLGGTLLIEAIYVLDHSRFVTGFRESGFVGTYARSNGPATHLLYAGLLAAQLFVILRFAQAYLTPASSISRDQAKLLLAGALAKTSYNFGFSAGIIPFFLSRGYLFNNPTSLLQGATALSGVAVGAFLAYRFSPGRGFPLRDFGFLGGVFGLGILSGALDAQLFTFGVIPNPYYLTAAPVWRILSAGFFAYAILRYQLFDIDFRLKRLMSRSLQATGGVGIFTGVSFALLSVLGASPAGIVTSQLVGGTAVLLTLGPLGLAGRALAERAFPADVEAPDYVLERKLAVYRAALEGALEGSGTLTGADVDLLRTLRSELGLTEREHAIMEYAVRRTMTKATEPPAVNVTEGDVLLGKYRIQQLLGEGTSGRTYLATSGSHAPLVAIKHVRRNLSNGLQQKILQEAKVLAAVRHPNVVMLMDVDQAGEDVFIVMEYADGGSLKDRLAEGGPLPLPEACSVLRDLLQGLKAVHEHGIVHRDVKPANLLLTTSGGAKVADFGLARAAVPADATLDGFGTIGVSAGTPAYMSPEQARGSRVDARTDLYAAASVFYEALTGRTYLDFTGLTEFEIRGAILAQAPDLSLQEQPAWVLEFLRRGLEKDPGRRFQSADEMLGALRRGAGQMLPLA